MAALKKKFLAIFLLVTSPKFFFCDHLLASFFSSVIVVLTCGSFLFACFDVLHYHNITKSPNLEAHFPSCQAPPNTYKLTTRKKKHGVNIIHHSITLVYFPEYRHFY